MVVGKLMELQESAAKVVAFLTNPALVKQLRNDKAYNLELLRTEHQARAGSRAGRPQSPPWGHRVDSSGARPRLPRAHTRLPQIGEADIEALYHYAKFQYECGNYSNASEFLRYFRSLCSSPERSVAALWGKFAADILMQDWDEAAEDMTRLKEVIDAKMGANPLGALQQRTWLAHWSLFVFFNHENGLNAIIDLLFQDRYLNAIQTSARHLLRYLAVAVVVNKRRRNMLKDLVRLLQQEAYAYSDPITSFLECLFVRYDFDGAQARLAECDALLRADFFLVGCREEFMERARFFIFETYCRIHQCIDVRALAGRLGMPQEDAERWVVNLIRSERLPAKIDAQAGTVVMGAVAPSVYETIIDRTKQLSFRSFQMSNALLTPGAAA